MMMPIGIHGIFPVMTQKRKRHSLGPNQDFVEPFGSNGLNQLSVDDIIDPSKPIYVEISPKVPMNQKKP
jgi:hypothetical protein